MSSLHHYTKEELVKLKRKYDMQVSKEAIEEIKRTIDLDKEIERLQNDYEIEHIQANHFMDMTDDLLKENTRLNNIINDLLDRQNEALRYIGNHLSLDSRYKHGNGDEELILVRKILNKHIKELKGSDKE